MKLAATITLATVALMATSSAAERNVLEEPYPFQRFDGEWKLKDDEFQQVWDGETVETLSIPGHRTNCSRVNTNKSVLCVVDAVDFQGHILWVVNPKTRAVTHLSHFGEDRLGRGTGRMEENGDLMLSIRFTDEPPGSSRKYRYTWVSDDEYTMKSIQYDDAGRPTGNWYGGTFMRVGSGE